MNNHKTSKLDIYKAAGFTMLLVALAFPASILGLRLLNYVLGNIKF